LQGLWVWFVRRFLHKPRRRRQFTLQRFYLLEGLQHAPVDAEEDRGADALPDDVELHPAPGASPPARDRPESVLA